jgi:hypothetical protein
MARLNGTELALDGTDIPMSLELTLARCNRIGFDALDVLVLGLIRVPLGKVIANNSSTLVARVRPPSKVKYGALPWMTLRVVWVVKAWLLKAESNKMMDDNAGISCRDKFGFWLWYALVENVDFDVRRKDEVR